MKYNLINLLSAYAFTVRYFNGEHFDFANEAVAAIASISLALKKGQNFEDYETAVKSVEQECINVSKTKVVFFKTNNSNFFSVNG